jgi:hypothetical protein
MEAEFRAEIDDNYIRYLATTDLDAALSAAFRGSKEPVLAFRLNLASFLFSVFSSMA